MGEAWSVLPRNVSGWLSCFVLSTWSLSFQCIFFVAVFSFKIVYFISATKGVSCSFNEKKCGDSCVDKSRKCSKYTHARSLICPKNSLIKELKNITVQCEVNESLNVCVCCRSHVARYH